MFEWKSGSCRGQIRLIMTRLRHLMNATDKHGLDNEWCISVQLKLGLSLIGRASLPNVGLSRAIRHLFSGIYIGLRCMFVLRVLEAVLVKLQLETILWCSVTVKTTACD